MELRAKFKIVYSEEVVGFLESIDIKARAKILYNINKSKFLIDKAFFKKLGDTDIWEFRTLYSGICYRIFAFWDFEQETIVLTTHGIIKKSQKTPAKEIAKAEDIRKKYFNNKRK